MTAQPNVAAGDARVEGGAVVGGDRRIAAVYGLLLGGLLIGYMFLGRGFAHIGIGPIFIGDVVMVVGILAAAMVLLVGRRIPPINITLVAILAFALLGAARTVPYLGTFGMDALRDGVLWGYAAFALIVYVIADRRLVLESFRGYGWVVPAFALWLPICWNLFRAFSADIDPDRPGDVVPLVFFKGGDMTIHTVGAIAFLVLGAAVVASVRTFAWRMALFVPLLWTIFVAGTSNRGAMVTAILGVLVVVAFAPRSRNWLPLVAAIGLGISALLLEGALVALGGAGPPTAAPASTASPATAEYESTRVVITNSGFEHGAIRSGAIDGWTIFGSGTYNIVAGRAYRGENFALIDNTADAYQATVTSDTFPVDAENEIKVSAWVRAVTGRPIVDMYINWFDRTGRLLASEPAELTPTEGSVRWQEIVGVRAVPDRAASASVLFYEAAGSAALAIDQVTARSGAFPSDEPIEVPAPVVRRPATLEQLAHNVASLFSASEDPGLEGTKQFRLAWWGSIVDYTVFGEHFWGGKGFGVNLADDDGFQSTADGSLRAPHNSHLTVLARMGVPGLALWIVIQGAFGIGVWRALRRHRSAGNAHLAAIGAWILVYWFAIMVNTSFDPYLEGPQGGIWLWALIGFGLTYMRLAERGPGRA